MGKYAKLRLKILSGEADAAIDFAAPCQRLICQLLIRLGFDERIKGSHHIFSRGDVDEILNLQAKGAKAKPYQVRQVRGVLVRYRLGGRDVDPI